MRFESPENFILLILLIPLFLFKGKGNSELLSNNSLKFINSKLFDHKVFLYKLLPYLRIIFFILIIFALSRPQYGSEIIKTKIKGIDIILAIDISKSMLAEDLKPNRLNVSKNVIKNFIKNQKNNRIGLVAFSGNSKTISPLTLDYKYLLGLIDKIESKLIIKSGTAIGNSIVNALYRFDHNIKKRKKIIILLTDGENNAGEISLPKAIEMSKIKNVKIYTIGVGKTSGSPIPIIKNGKRLFAKDFNGNMIISKINEFELESIAKSTNGKFFRAENKKELNNIYNEIEKIEKTEISVSSINYYSEKMYLFLIPAIFLITFSLILERFYLKEIIL